MICAWTTSARGSDNCFFTTGHVSWVLIGQLLLALLNHQVVHGKLYRLPQLLRMAHYKGFVGVYDEHQV